MCASTPSLPLRVLYLKEKWISLMKDVEVDDNFRSTRVKLAVHNLEVTLKRTMEGCFRAAKKMASESFEGAKEMDAFVRQQYADEPRKMAEWEAIMQKYEFMDEPDEDQESQPKV
jgi:hypothetical protein